MPFALLAARKEQSLFFSRFGTHQTCACARIRHKNPWISDIALDDCLANQVAIFQS